VRGLSRFDRDAIAASMLADVARQRWQAAVPELSSASVRHEAHNLPGILVFAASVPPATAQKALAAAQDVMKALAQTGPTPDELARAASATLAEIGKRAAASWIKSRTCGSILSFKRLRSLRTPRRG
jgi:hypothetical protein